MADGDTEGDGDADTDGVADVDGGADGEGVRAALRTCELTRPPA
ncbi:MAG: hypothetical protein R5N71_03950 [Cutibacterium granulosum]|nr:hypothetical protein [Cutibacterium granulosum]MEA5642399.1 hypothetical protein [Cutibacterium granulosum]MEA5648576.1 hypothetical protein [Cutibacterium granulosum]MEA5654157.1 hypothetical protein [Cutibacterium granulosum]MEA5663029.1 hypothetical protein [Cutibacterium granulosum]MEA5665220.1 hypothetical protein [Cutibacterium granulosum]